MNIITAQLTPLTPLLSKDPMPKREFVKKAHAFTDKRGLANLLEMIEFNEAHLSGNEIVLK